MNLALVGIIASLGAAAAMGVLVWKTASAHVWKLNADAQEKRAVEAERRETRALEQLAEARVVIERLEKIPDLERLIRLMGEQYERAEARGIARSEQLVEQIAAHEKRAHDRHRQLLRAVESAAA